MSKYLVKSDICPSQDEWIREAKADPSADKIGMFLTHTGIVRKTSKARVRFHKEDAPDVTKMLFSYDEDKVNNAISSALGLPGIFYVRVWLSQGELMPGDTIMQVLIGGDIRPNVIACLQDLVGTLKNECVTEEEI